MKSLFCPPSSPLNFHDIENYFVGDLTKLSAKMRIILEKYGDHLSKKYKKF